MSKYKAASIIGAPKRADIVRKLTDIPGVEPQDVEIDTEFHVLRTGGRQFTNTLFRMSRSKKLPKALLEGGDGEAVGMSLLQEEGFERFRDLVVEGLLFDVCDVPVVDEDGERSVWKSARSHGHEAMREVVNSLFEANTDLLQIVLAWGAEAQRAFDAEIEQTSGESSRSSAEQKGNAKARLSSD